MASEAGSSTYEVIRYEARSLPFAYVSLVVSKWARSFKYGNYYIKLIDDYSYFKSYSRYIQQLLALKETVVRLAVLSDDSDVVLGFSVTSGRTLQYVHVHRNHRRQGIAKSLIPADIDSFTHLTEVAFLLWPTKMPKAKFIIYAPEN